MPGQWHVGDGHGRRPRISITGRRIDCWGFGPHQPGSLKTKSKRKPPAFKSEDWGTRHPEIPNQRLRRLSGSEPGNYKTKTPTRKPDACGTQFALPLSVRATRPVRTRTADLYRVNALVWLMV